MTPSIPANRNPLRHTPVIGPVAADVTSGLTSPFGIVSSIGTLGMGGVAVQGGRAGLMPVASRFLGMSPKGFSKGIAGSIIGGTGGKAIEDATGSGTFQAGPVSIGPRGVGEFFGGVWGGPPRPKTSSIASLADDAINIGDTVASRGRTTRTYTVVQEGGELRLVPAEGSTSRAQASIPYDPEKHIKLQLGEGVPRPASPTSTRKVTIEEQGPTGRKFVARVGKSNVEYGVTGETSGHVTMVNVIPQQRGKGIGRQLVDAAIDDILARNPNVTQITADITSGEGARLFRNRGGQYVNMRGEPISFQQAHNLAKGRGNMSGVRWEGPVAPHVEPSITPPNMVPKGSQLGFGMGEQPVGTQGELFPQPPQTGQVAGTPAGSGQQFRLDQATPPVGAGGLSRVPGAFTEGGQPTTGRLGGETPPSTAPVEGTPAGSGDAFRLGQADAPTGTTQTPEVPPRGAEGNAQPPLVQAAQAAQDAPGALSRANAILARAAKGKKVGVRDRRVIARAYGKDFADTLAPEGPGFLGEVLGFMNLPRAILASGEVSGSFRQLGIPAIAHPEFIPRIFSAQARALKEIGANEVEASIAKHSRFTQAVDAGVEFSSHRPGEAYGGVGTYIQEENFLKGRGLAARITRKVPILRQSERMYVTAMNKIRMDYYDHLMTKLNVSNDDIKLQKHIASYVNHATGRGLTGVRPDNAVLALLNAAFFSPRLLASRVQVIGNLRHKALRGEVAKDLAKFYGAAITMTGLLSATGAATVELDPRSSDFGKAKIGDQRLDFFGGYQPIMRHLAVMASGQSKAQTGEILDTSFGDALTSAVRSKLSPAAGLITDVVTGSDVIGRPVDPTDMGDIANMVTKNAVPLLYQDVYDAIKQEGITGGLLAASTGSIGLAGSSTYEPSARAQRLEHLKEQNPDLDIRDRGVVNMLSQNDPTAAALLEKERTQQLERGSDFAVTRQENEAFFREQETSNNLPSIAQSFQEGNHTAGPAFVEAFKNYEDDVIDTIRRQFFGEEATAHSPVAKALQTYREVKPEFDPVTNSLDFGKYFSERDRAFAQVQRLNPEVARVVKESVRSYDPAVQSVERQLKSARTQFHKVLSMPKWVAEVENQDEIEKIHRDIQYLNQQLAIAGHANVSTGRIYRMLEESGDYSPELVQTAYKLRPGSKSGTARLSPERRKYLVDNFRTLSPFFPNLYRSEEILTEVGRKYGKQAISSQLVDNETNQ